MYATKQQQQQQQKFNKAVPKWRNQKYQIEKQKNGKKKLRTETSNLFEGSFAFPYYTRHFRLEIN